MPPELHSPLGASGAKRWLNCPPSVKLSEGLPDTASSYAAAGTLAHAIAELKAQRYFMAAMSTRAYNAEMKRLKADPNYDRAMDGDTDTYLEHLKALAMSYGTIQPFVALETRVDYGDYAPGGFGTADCIIIGGDRMCVADYKNGAGVPVDAEMNPQMMLYALGALKVYWPIYGDSIKHIHLSIIQPNSGGIKEWDTTMDAVRDWGEKVVKPAAALAAEGKGDAHPGEWCRFCKAHARCTARAKMLLELEAQKGAKPEAAADGAEGPLLTDAQIGDVLARALELESWVKDLKDYALTAALGGREIPGFKVVEGRGTRDWIGGADTAFAQLTARGIQEALLWERKPKSVAGLEKDLGKKVFADAAADLWEKSPGKPALVPASDKRPPYTQAKAVFQPVETN